ncbi:PREDICTED: THAP domain-containing protein 2-like [Cyprinodon variegatus]|uniref:THAP domain-containing protein 2-like n=1 Tax=Cyprinodon variegatus TaxID=28743 RepID=UPI0007427319|nr:PREDICTED: THAP domain-containing protein 2-like [Cyprinodon variegatus]
MPTCMAVGCCNTSGKSDKNISYFMFPVHDPPRVRRWIANLKREDLPSDFWPEKKHVICSQHFEKECFQEDMRARIFAGVYGEESPLANQRRRLTPTAVPTLFCYTTGKKKRPLSMNRRQLARQHNTASEAVGSTGANGDRKSVSVEERSSAASTSRRPKRKRRSFCDSATQCTKTETCDTGVQCDLLSPYDGRSTKSERGQNVWELETENIKVETVQIKVEPE